MSKQNLERALQRELHILNYQIDEKIIKGLSYSKEARRHKIILASLANIRRTKSASNWFTRSFSII